MKKNNLWMIVLTGVLLIAAVVLLGLSKMVNLETNWFLCGSLLSTVLANVLNFIRLYWN